MILNVFRNPKRFVVLFLLILLIDILVKLYASISLYRFFSKPFVLILLFVYYRMHNNGRTYGSVELGLICFFLGDLFIISHKNVTCLGLSIIFFSLGKVCFGLRFSHKTDFNVSRLIPFSLVMFVYTVFLVSQVFENLKDFFVPALISFFLSLLMFQFAFLRKGVFNKKSYLYIFYGVMMFIFSEGIMAIKTFKMELPFQDVLIMLLYGLSVYFIIEGLNNEREINASLPVLNPKD
ncbi:hypothetical protein GCM10023311_27690 [Flaviramulus aquimarinus]|uniref:YhhN-like protein n=1 Tax=Flaviramulus aquimarinus TaxID=1170456 RepID=A0ABP9FF84_9FLAO